ncbi:MULTISPECIES: glycine C-acetyltransferase [Legionella]|uniref:2-amino-3-ketobutyrate coenzyme A ligase n=1 Tax=Legionella septentrionalis TaxID=2498109 RepID=A0A433JM88_9GAMM|nr:glycine C-acetyltransferase [Legionella septentrionalis]MCP0913046.1 glycine C-acetyltransferase [Legionella sp. 27cVA30]RUQ91501.1 glycine C-acetyltransferase [Legionella septentrionalis]RUQ98495.1 glycine C-acetyltransferase [Legionella septentrionalis]RUR10879.1 glycine C-acetyltransferase [Legionella septentrionalis]RUR14587.1 glycine C-acetyltransferase [Legionella septentrionalis]
MDGRFIEFLQNELHTLKEEGLYKPERVISSQQQAEVEVNHEEVINLCANNYLGLANHAELIAEGQRALAQYGYGMASVRFICGTQTPHKQLEKKISTFLGKEDTILYSSCFDANTGLFETLLGPEDAIISDALNHASIIDGVRLCKAQRYRYANNDMKDLETQLQAAKDARFRLIATDGVFSMDGILANLPAICELAEKYRALVMVDDSHAVGFIGATGRGTPEYFDVSQQVDIVTGTLGKALGGASGGYTAGNAVIVDWLRQRSRPYLFSNTLAPVIAQTSIAVLDLLERNQDLLKKLQRNSDYFRAGLSKLGFKLIPGEHPIIPVMLGDAALAARMAQRLLVEGIYVVGFSFPVVPKGMARIRTQMSAALELHHLDKALAAFEKVGQELSVI